MMPTKCWPKLSPPTYPMSISELSQALGVPPKWREELWPRFEQCALSVVAEGCELLRSDGRRGGHWREPHYSWALRGHLSDLCRSRNLPFYPSDERRLLSDEEFAQGADPKESPRIDFVMHWHNLEPSVYFGIEAKVLVTRAISGYRPWDTVNGYVAGGIKRYVDERYAASLPSGSMVGYVLAGPPAKLVARINKRIKDLPLRYTQLLELCASQRVMSEHYESAHPRVSGVEIRLHHLLVVFDS